MRRPYRLTALPQAPRPLRPAHRSIALGLVLAAAVSMAACGGGGGGSDEPAPPELPAVVDAAPVAVGPTASALPAGWSQGPFMQIFVRAYQDSDGDGIGDLRGLTSRLDHLRDLGITGLWLMPITRSQDGDHGYAVADYRSIDPAYGTLADFDELLRQAHARGIGVILDHVVNHSAAQHPAFVNSRAAASNPYRSWYVWQSPAPAGWSIYGSNPWKAAGSASYFAAFWDQMPDWNLRNPAVVNFHHDALRFWLNRGADGFRFDAVGHLFENGANAWNNQAENYPFMNGIRGLLDGYANRYMVCEGPGDPRGFNAASACRSAFAFGHNYEMVNAAKGSGSAVRNVASWHGASTLGMATMLANHDSFAGDRLWNQFGGNQAAYRLAAATLLLQPGVPFLYYGEEIGMARAASLGGDPGLRTPMSWTADTNRAGFTTGTPFRALSANVATHNVAAQQADPGSLLNYYKALIALRSARPSLARGSYEQPASDGLVMSFQRREGAERTLVVINYGTAAADAAVQGLPAGAALAPLGPGGGTAATADSSGAAVIAVPAQTARVFDVR